MAIGARNRWILKDARKNGPQFDIYTAIRVSWIPAFSETSQYLKLEWLEEGLHFLFMRILLEEGLNQGDISNMAKKDINRHLLLFIWTLEFWRFEPRIQNCEANALDIWQSGSSACVFSLKKWSPEMYLKALRKSCPSPAARNSYIYGSGNWLREGEQLEERRDCEF